MPGKTQPEIDLKTLKPSKEGGGFDPVYEVESCKAYAQSGGDTIRLGLKPVSGGAHVLGRLTIRVPAVLGAGGPLDSIAVIVGQDPARGFSLESAVGARVRVTLSQA